MMVPRQDAKALIQDFHTRAKTSPPVTHSAMQEAVQQALDNSYPGAAQGGQTDRE